MGIRGNRIMGNTRCKYNWKVIEPYLDVIIENGSTGRKQKYITFREFKNNIQNGMSCLDMTKDQDMSSLFISFLSKFSQGKINLKKEEFVNSYNRGMSLNEISKKYNVYRYHIRFLRQLYGIKRKGASFIHRKKTEIPLTQRQKEILYGSMMGDAYTHDIRYNSIVSFRHSKKQERYLFWKYQEFKNIVSDIYPKFQLRKEERDEYKGGTESWHFQTSANSDIEDCLNEFYKNGKKEINDAILNKLSSLSLSVWFMDDGYAIRNKTKNENKISNFALCTDSFSKKSCNNIINWFKKRYSIDAYLRKRGLSKKGRMMYRVIVRSKSASLFISLVKPYIISYFCLRKPLPLWEGRNETLNQP